MTEQVEVEISKEDYEFMRATSLMIKDLVFHCIAAYQAKEENRAEYRDAFMMTHIFANALGNAYFELSLPDKFKSNCYDFIKTWENWIENAESPKKKEGSLQ